MDVLRLRPDAILIDTGPDLAIRCRTGATSVVRPSAGIRAAVGTLAAGDAREPELTALVAAADGEAALFTLHATLRRLDVGGWLEHAVATDGSALVRLRPTGSGGRVRPTAPSTLDGVGVKLSRFAVAQARDGQLALSAPDSAYVAVLGAAAVPLLAALAGWTTPAALDAAFPALGAPALRHTLALLADARVLVTGGADADPEDTAERAGWTPAELWLHTRSRRPALSPGWGSTYARAVPAPPPASRPAWPGPRVRLPRPDLARVAARDPALTEALEGRRSGREHGSEPMSVDQLGELLFRVQRRRRSGAGPDGLEWADRPYPSSGGAHELEVYPLVTACAGLEPGLWHYDSAAHALDLVTPPDAATARLVAAARRAALLPTDPQVLLVVAARFGRIQWRYEQVAYALTLKHVGVLYQTVYLVAAAMGLAACALADGDAGDFAAATGLDPRVEGSVGELVLGSPPDGVLDAARQAVRGSA